jgi:hypothetical protein
LARRNVRCIHRLTSHEDAAVLRRDCCRKTVSASAGASRCLLDLAIDLKPRFNTRVRREVL